MGVERYHCNDVGATEEKRSYLNVGSFRHIPQLTYIVTSILPRTSKLQARVIEDRPADLVRAPQRPPKVAGNDRNTNHCIHILPKY